MRAPSFHLDGGGTGVLLVHGLTGTPTEMAHVGRRLHQRGFTVHAPILAGHCGSERDLIATGWRDWLESVERAQDWLARRVDKVCIAGLSMGAVLALQAAARRPESVAAIGLYSTTLWYDGWSMPPGMFLLPLVLRLPFLGRRMRFMEPYPYGIKDERIRKYILARMEAGDSQAAGLRGMPAPSLTEMRRLIGSTKRLLADVTAPTLIVHAANDDMTSVRNADYVAKRVRGKVSKVLLNNSYHLITVDAERDRVADLTAEFFAAAAPPAAPAVQPRSAAAS